MPETSGNKKPISISSETLWEMRSALEGRIRDYRAAMEMSGRNFAFWSEEIKKLEEALAELKSVMA